MSKQTSDTKPQAKANPNRREFIDKSGKIAAVAGIAVTAPAINVLGQNEVMRLGIIGSGKRGRYLMTQAMQMSQRKEKTAGVCLPLPTPTKTGCIKEWIWLNG